MGELLIENSSGAFQPLALNAEFSASPSSTYRIFQNTGALAINQGEWVQLDTTGTQAHIYGISRGLHGVSNINLAMGVSADAIPVNGFGRVVVDGPALARVGAAGVATGNLLSASTVVTDDGRLVLNAAPGTAGNNIGIALQAGAASANAVAIYVMKF